MRVYTVGVALYMLASKLNPINEGMQVNCEHTL